MESNCGDSGQTYRALVGYGMYSDFIVTKTLGAFHQWLSGGKKKKIHLQCSYLRDVGSIPGSGRSPGEKNDNPLKYSCLENPVDRGAWQTTVPVASKSQT